jgi:hypothetical protein
MKENQFETIKRQDDNGVEFWSSRDLAKTLEYSDYRNFQTVISKAKVACENSGEVIHNHFVEATDMVETGSGAERGVDTIDGYFASVKKKVAAHHGLRKDRRYKLICQLLRGS